jgi:hypothetical protein
MGWAIEPLGVGLGADEDVARAAFRSVERWEPMA